MVAVISTQVIAINLPPRVKRFQKSSIADDLRHCQKTLLRDTHISLLACHIPFITDQIDQTAKIV